MTNGAPDSAPADFVERPLDGSLRARFAAFALSLLGWRVVLVRPVPMKCVVVFYPHTSNWDFAIGLLAKWMIAIPVRFIAKDSLFVGPFARLFAHWGGIPVNRRTSTGVIAQLAARFAVETDFRLAIAPEVRAAAPSTGRAASTTWRSTPACRWRWRSSTIRGARSASART